MSGNGSRRADAVLFGFDFQINAAIVLMLENIKDLSSIRLEGNCEDIEIKLNDDTRILAQAKAVQAATSDFRNVRTNLKKALETLSEQNKTDVKKLILITNSPNPFNDDSSKSAFYGHAHRDYSSLPPTAKKIVDDYLDKLAAPLDTNKFHIQVLPFETDDETERYKVVMQVVNDFIGSTGANLSPGIGKKLFGIWKNEVFVNGTKKDASIELTKKSIIWPIIVIETDITHCDDDFLEQFETGVYDEVVRLYASTIDSCCERIDFVTKVIFDFTQFSSTKKPIEKCLEFVDSMWENYRDEFVNDNIDEEVLEALTKIVLYNVIRRRIIINNVKKGVNL